MQAASSRVVGLLAVAAVISLCGCATLPGADYPRAASAALEHPEQTSLGSKVLARSRLHPGLSGFKLLPSGVDGFVLRAQMANAAQRTLDVQYYVFHNDDTGQLLLDAMLKAARRGVRIRLLIDDSTVQGEETQVAALAAHPNFEVRLYNPFNYRGSIQVLRATELVFGMSRLNYRMHNKLLVADNSVAIAGGRNIGDEYFGEGKTHTFGDYDVFAQGPIVRDLSKSFDEYWNSELAIPAQALYANPPTAEQLKDFEREIAEHKYESASDGMVKRTASGQPLNGFLTSDTAVTWAHGEAVYDSPYKKDVDRGDAPGRLLRRRLLDEMAKVRSELLIVSPYFVPGQLGSEAIEDLRKRGVRVRVLTNSLESTDVPPVHVGYRRYRKELLEEGVELYEVKPVLGKPPQKDGLFKAPSGGQFALHAKVYEFDRARVFVGSANFDPRSFHLNTELGLLIESPVLAQQVVANFNAVAAPDNSYVPKLVGSPAGRQVVWYTKRDNELVELAREPAEDRLKELEINMLSVLPIEDQL